MADIFLVQEGQDQVLRESKPRVAVDKEFMWVDLHSCEDGAVSVLRSVYECHPLILNQVENGTDRPRVSTYDKWNHIVFSAVCADNREEQLNLIHVIFGGNVVITVYDEEPSPIARLRMRLESEGGSTLLAQGAGFFVYTLLDELTDARLEHLDSLQDRIDDLEDEIILTPDYRLYESILGLRRRLQRERRIASAEREVVNSMLRPEFPHLGRELDRYMLDLYYHVSRVLEITDTEREHLMALAEMLMASTAQKTNDIMKLLTVVSTIFMPLTLITGIYGMNFIVMPELSWPWGYPLVMGAMVAIVGAMLLFFRRKGWL